MLGLFPIIYPYNNFFLDVPGGHKLYVEECGNKFGIPILFLHGGPGSGADVSSRRFFCPNTYRIIIFDQRGSGRSIPHACSQNNSTQDLIADIELLRKHLAIDKWILFGGSWGATLALVYAQAYAQHVSYMILRGVFLGRSQDISWLLEPEYAARIFPEKYHNFISIIPADKRNNIIDYCYDLLTTSADEVLRMAVARAWAGWEAACSSLEVNFCNENQRRDPHLAIGCATLEAHYFKHNCFLQNNQILQNMHKICHIPGVIIHGRYDMVCPVDNSFELHKAWKHSTLNVVRLAGHSAKEPLIIHALIEATNNASLI